MFGLQMLDVAIGVIFVFVLVSLICSAVREGVETFLKTRAAYLEFGIRELLHDKGTNGLAKSFFEHPVIYSLYSEPYPDRVVTGRPSNFARGKGLPSYIPSKNFALVMMDIAARGPETNEFTAGPGTPPLTLASVRANIMNIENAAVQRAMLGAIDAAEGDLGRAQENLAAWYDSSMDRVSGWYKRATQKVLFLVGLLVAVTMNIDTLSIAEYLYNDETARAAIVARAEAAVADSAFLSRSYDQTKAELAELDLPIGWDGARFGLPLKPDTVMRMVNGVAARVVVQPGPWAYVSPLAGWLITALAATLGAPFWFDILNKVMVIRSTVKPREKSREEGSEDRQTKEAGGEDEAPSEAAKESIVVAPNALVVETGGGPPGPAAPPPVVPGVLVPAGRDAHAGVDGCDVEAHALADIDLTSDEELPVAEGGVA
jgi:hypothetical protein